MATPALPLVAFDESGENVAYCGPEGSLKIWEINSGSLKQEYVPSSHLSSICTCLSWMPIEIIEFQKNRKKKRKSEKEILCAKTIAMGTLKGKILLYNVSEGDLGRELSEGHVDSVNDIQWSLSNGELFSCSHDGHVIRWDLHKSKPKSKWRADKGSISRILLSKDGETLFTAGKTILWWDIEKQQILKKFTGHATQILQLKLITFPEELMENGYIVSCAAADRSLSVWPLKSRARNAILTCNLAEDPLTFDVYAPESRSEKVVIASVTKSGIMQIFEQQLNGKRGPPQEAQASLKIVDSEDNPKPVRIVSCLLGKGTSKNVTVAYDNKLHLRCETLELKNLREDMCIVRADKVSKDGFTHSKLKTRSTDTSPKKLLTSSALAPELPSQVNETSDRKRKSTKDDKSTDLPMDKRLNALRLDVTTGENSKVSSDNVAHLLIQGLHSNDETILNQVFSCRKVEAIEKTISRLPIEIILPLLKELQHRIFKRWNSIHLLAWIKCILITHTSFLTTCPELSNFLLPIYQVMDVKINLYKKMSHLKGKMDLLVSRLEVKDKKEEKSMLNKQTALTSFQDESTEDEESEIEEAYANNDEDDDLLSEDGETNMQVDSDEESMEEDNNESDSS